MKFTFFLSSETRRIFGSLPILYIAGFKGTKMVKFIPNRKNATIRTIEKPILRIFSQYGFCPSIIP